MREHGVDMPDPKFEGGRVTHARGRRAPTRTRCAPPRRRARSTATRSSRRSSPTSSRRSSRRRRSANARCMREHGIDFPDPQFDANGGAQIQIGKRQRHRPGHAEVPGGAEGVREDAARRAEHGDAGGGREVRARSRPAARRRGALAAGGVLVAPAATSRRRRRSAAAAAARPRPSSGATSSTARASPARSATPTRARCARAPPAR